MQAENRWRPAELKEINKKLTLYYYTEKQFFVPKSSHQHTLDAIIFLKPLLTMMSYFEYNFSIWHMSPISLSAVIISCCCLILEVTCCWHWCFQWTGYWLGSHFSVIQKRRALMYWNSVFHNKHDFNIKASSTKI